MEITGQSHIHMIKLDDNSSGFNTTMHVINLLYTIKSLKQENPQCLEDIATQGNPNMDGKLA